MGDTRRFKYPVDTDQFQIIREGGYLYVDKTGLMHGLVGRYRYVFLARPRRFGKSLLCSTLKAYFEGRRELFEGLEAGRLEREWRKHPVLHFSMGGLKNCTVPEARNKLGTLLRGYEAVYGRDPLAESPGDRLRSLILRAREQAGAGVVVILDEYDAPVVRLLHDGERREAMRSVLREFYQVLKEEGASLRFVFVTGVTKFSQMSIFSEINNLVQISMLDDYSGICGITQGELEGALRPCVAEYAGALGIGEGEAYALLKKNYDGYRFSARGEEVYAPFSLLRALDGRDTGHYWFESGTPTALIEHLRHYPGFNPLDYDGVEVSEGAFNKPCEHADTPVPLLYQSGYLSIDRYDGEMKTYVLHFPNREVRQGMVENLADYLLGTDMMDRDAAIIGMSRALLRGDLGGALAALRSWIGGLPYDVIGKKEWMRKRDREGFFQMLMYTVFSLLNSKVDTEVRSVRGRADVVIQTRGHVYVLELKVDGSAEAALEQIEERGYAVPYEAGGRAVVKCGAVISSEERNLAHWKITDGDGTVIEER